MVMGSLTTSQKGTGHGVHRPQVTEELVMGFCKHKSQRSWSWGSPTTSYRGVGHEVPNHKSQRSQSCGSPTISHKEVGHGVSWPQVTEKLVMGFPDHKSQRSWSWGFPTTSHRGVGHGFPNHKSQRRWSWILVYLKILDTIPWGLYL